MNLSGEIGIILNLTPTYPRDEHNEADVNAAKFVDGFFNRSFLDPAVKGGLFQKIWLLGRKQMTCCQKQRQKI